MGNQMSGPQEEATKSETQRNRKLLRKQWSSKTHGSHGYRHCGRWRQIHVLQHECLRLTSIRKTDEGASNRNNSLCDSECCSTRIDQRIVKIFDSFFSFIRISNTCPAVAIVFFILTWYSFQSCALQSRPAFFNVMKTGWFVWNCLNNSSMNSLSSKSKRHMITLLFFIVCFSMFQYLTLKPTRSAEFIFSSRMRPLLECERKRSRRSIVWAASAGGWGLLAQGSWVRIPLSPAHSAENRNNMKQPPSLANRK